MLTLCSVANLRRLTLRSTLCSVSFGLCACSDPQIDALISQEISSESGSALVVRATDGYNDEQVTPSSVSIEIDDGSGSFRKVEPEVFDGERARLDVVLVLDNSSSLTNLEETIRDATRDFAYKVLSMGEGSRVGLVRVSTEARVLTELTADRDEVDAGIAAMFISNGWTAFYDGVRLANEVLERGSVTEVEEPCAAPVFRAIVAFTSGDDNNSADQQRTSYAGDGIDTTPEMLKNLRVNGARTPLFNLGVGKRVSVEMLEDLSTTTGGIFATMSGYNQLGESLLASAQSVFRARFVCFAGNVLRARVKVSASTKLGKASDSVTLTF